MLRSNTKKAKENILNHIRTTSAYYYIEDCGAPKDIGIDDLCALILHDFRTAWAEEIRNNARRQKPKTYQEMFTDWGSGLCAGSLFDYFLGDAVQVLGDILEETEDERKQFSEYQAEQMLSRIIYREVTDHARKVGETLWG